MKYFKTSLILLILLFSSLVMPVSSYPEVPGDVDTYYPLEAGDEWTYRFGNIKGTVRYEAAGRLEEYDGYLVKCFTSMIDVNILTESIIGRRDGRILLIGGTDIPSGNSRLIYGHSEVILQSPLAAGAVWGYEKDYCANGLTCKVECRVVKFTDCVVEAGRFEDVCVVQRTTRYIDKDNREKSSVTHNEYYAPHVGRIKEESVEDAGTSVLTELTGYKVKGSGKR